MAGGADDFLTYIDRAFIINLPERGDRRRDMLIEFNALFDEDLVGEKVEVLPAIKPADRGPFASVGTHGCFLSHLRVLENALDHGYQRIAVFEDDATFFPYAERHLGMLTQDLAHRPWDYAHFGYADVLGVVDHDPAGEPTLISLSQEVQGAHFVCFDRPVIPRLIEHLLTCIAGTPGDRLRGPMPLDGAYNTFRWVNDDVVRLAAVPSQARQRSSRSDVSPRPLDRVKLFAPAMAAARKARHWVKSRHPV